METLHLSWQRAWQALAAAGSGVALRDALLARYAEPHRRYHTLQHLAECIAQLEPARHLAEHPGEVEIALWFHDAVYELQSKQNEADSAAWAEQALAQAGVAEAGVRRVGALVMATRHDALPSAADEQLLVDVDLAILGAPPARFAEYERQVREEYAWVPEPAFQQGRSAVLQQFLQREAIYSTLLFRERLEASARDNLRSSLAKLAD
ncbi:MAG TPA: N-methyl-D-aspartate receptor NMDAR2C subunit [Ideonella sp.]|nr:N-methyl-D-aspartate receptor NMDAR2C subunit [Ideonella sp.]